MSNEGMPSMKGTPQQQQQLMASQRSIHENDGHYGPPGGWQDEADTGLMGPATHNISFPMHPDSTEWNSSDRMNSRNMAASGGPVGVPGPPGGGEDTAELAVSRKRKHEELADREERDSRAASAGSKVRRSKVTTYKLGIQVAGPFGNSARIFYFRGAQESFPRKPFRQAA